MVASASMPGLLAGLALPAGAAAGSGKIVSIGAVLRPALLILALAGLPACTPNGGRIPVGAPPARTATPAYHPAESPPDSAVLGSTQAAHALTRGHNRKVILDPDSGRYYVFWLKIGGPPDPPNGMVYQFSTDGLTWSRPAWAGFVGEGATAFDVVPAPGGFYALGLSKVTPPDPISYAVRKLGFKPDGTLELGPPSIVHESSTAESVHFYGSLLRDGEGTLWVAARVGDATPGTHAEIIRSTLPESLEGWGRQGCTGAACNKAWANPFPAVRFEKGTIASRLLDLGEHGVGVVTYNKRNGPPYTSGQIIFSLNPTRSHDGWGRPVLSLTRDANQSTKADGEDRTRLDDRRFAALADPRTGIIHVAYISRDTPGPDSGTLRYFTLAPPYTTMASKSAEQTLVAAEVDGVHMSIDTRRDPSRLHIFYIENRHPDYQLRTLVNDGAGWPPASESRALTPLQGVLRYPQPPLEIRRDEFVVAFEQSRPDPANPQRFLYEIRAALVKLN
jgi:hypothetical protein